MLCSADDEGLASSVDILNSGAKGGGVEDFFRLKTD